MPWWVSFVIQDVLRMVLRDVPSDAFLLPMLMLVLMLVGRFDPTSGVPWRHTYRR